MTWSYLFAKGFQDITVLGSFTFGVLLIAFLFFLGEHALAVQILIAFVLSFFLVLLIRLFFFKERPQYEGYHDALEKINASSFPSTHVTRMFAFFIILANDIHDRFFVAFLFLLIFLVALSRVYLKKHYVKDVLFGALLGLLIGIGVVYFF